MESSIPSAGSYLSLSPELVNELDQDIADTNYAQVQAMRYAARHSIESRTQEALPHFFSLSVGRAVSFYVWVLPQECNPPQGAKIIHSKV